MAEKEGRSLSGVLMDPFGVYEDSLGSVAMQLIVVAVRDSAVDAFMRPFFVPSTGMAIRSFRDEVNRADSEMAKHPQDYELFQLGMFDEDTGRFSNAEAPRSLIRGADCKEKV